MPKNRAKAAGGTKQNSTHGIVREYKNKMTKITMLEAMNKKFLDVLSFKKLLFKISIAGKNIVIPIDIL